MSIRTLRWIACRLSVAVCLIPLCTVYGEDAPIQRAISSGRSPKLAIENLNGIGVSHLIAAEKMATRTDMPGKRLHDSSNAITINRQPPVPKSLSAKSQLTKMHNNVFLHLSEPRDRTFDVKLQPSRLQILKGAAKSDREKLTIKSLTVEAFTKSPVIDLGQRAKSSK